MDQEVDEVTKDDLSEFGSGVVVPLAKFSEHLWDGPAFSEALIREYDRFVNMTDDEKEVLEAEAKKYPDGDTARMLKRIGVFTSDSYQQIYKSKEEVLSHLIEMWMNGASDHFYDLDREAAPPSLVELADLTLRIGHGFTDQIWTMDHVKKIRDLWKKSCLEVDKLLGIDADWGRY